LRRAQGEPAPDAANGKRVYLEVDASPATGARGRVAPITIRRPAGNRRDCRQEAFKTIVRAVRTRSGYPEPVLSTGAGGHLCICALAAGPRPARDIPLLNVTAPKEAPGVHDMNRSARFEGEDLVVDLRELGSYSSA